jgi:hypothetical protein
LHPWETWGPTPASSVKHKGLSSLFYTGSCVE